MKRLILICITALLTAAAFCTESRTPAEKFPVSKVKVFLDDEELTLENDGLLPIRLSAILSYTKLQAGKSFTEKALLKEIEQTELRLLNSGLFYNAKVEKLASRKNPGTYVIYITVTTGFLKRYGGGGIYAVFGKAAVNKNRSQILWFAGWNKNGASYLNENTFGKPVILGADLFTDIPSCFAEKEGANVFAKATAGWLVTPDLRICTDVTTSFNFSQHSFNDSICVSPYLSETKYVKQNLLWTFETRFNFFPEDLWNFNIDSAFTLNYTPVKPLTFALLTAAGYSTENCSNRIRLYRSDRNNAYNLGLANKEVRSGYSNEELSVSRYVMSTTEIRWNAFSFMIPPCFPCRIVPYVFADAAYSGKILDAYGIGVYLNFDSPVFATFNFSYGINHNGKGRFSFAAMQSF